MRNEVEAIDLFCGVGGLTKGLENSGIDVKLGVDVDPNCEYPYMANNNSKFLLKSVENVQADDLKKYFKSSSYKLLAGCAPCQTFSSYNAKADSNDKRWWLLRQFSRLIKELSPEFVTMENVPGLIYQDVFKEFLNDLIEKKYHVDYNVVNCSDYGIPQNRRRLVLLASKLGSIKIIESSELGVKRKNVEDIIKDLPPIAAGESDLNDPLNRSSSLSEINMKRMRASKAGGTWRDWPDEIILKCHKKNSGKTYPSVYGRMRWEKPSPTITTQFYGFGNGRFGHPEQNRAISLREGALLQSFPQDYKFVSPDKSVNNRVLGRLIGNAVPVDLGYVIGKSIIENIKEI